jgi:hypothetical protein
VKRLEKNCAATCENRVKSTDWLPYPAINLYAS